MVLYLTLFIGILAAVIIGCCRFLKKGMPLFFKLVLSGFLCMGLGRLFELIHVFLFDALYSNFHIGKLAMAGGHLFLFTAYYGAMNSLLDEGERARRKYRLLGLIGPAAALLLCLLLPLAGLELLGYLSALAVCLSSLPALYFSFKYLIFPDDALGYIKSLRKYHFLVCLMLLECDLECIAMSLASGSTLYSVVWALNGFLLSAVYVLTMLFLIRGCRKWKA